MMTGRFFAAYQKVLHRVLQTKKSADNQHSLCPEQYLKTAKTLYSINRSKINKNH
jgi:hypothetical protein